PRPGSLLLVGDPKQSIYRFRRADIETYHLVRQRIADSGGGVLSLVTSFRSQPRMCEWINTVFASLLPPSATAVQAQFSPLTAAPAQVAEAAVYKLTSDSQRYQDVSGDESQTIADFIAASVKQGTHSYSDFLILTVRKNDLPLYQAALLERRIPTIVSADPSPLSGVGQALVQLLLVLVTPRDSIGLVGVLRGLLFGHSDEELFSHGQGAGRLRLEAAEGGHP
ncbi:unnamed protein product, partial [Phaeothamnion confervicola]